MDSDPEVVLVEKIGEDEISTDKDSGMESASGSKDETPERKPSTPEEPPKQPEPVKPAPVPESAPVPAPAPAPTPAAAPSAPSGSSSRPSGSGASQSSTTVARTNADDSFDDEPDETLGERLWGLTEMFPEPVRAFSGAVANLTVGGVKGLYSLTCNASWIFFTSSMILFAPVVFEVERAQMEEMQKSQQKQVLLGPGAAVGSGGGGPGGIPALPPMAAAR
uniref:Mitochondrial import receptor subunit TOM22 homolog n=1 Tax=Anopheles atroparvus TaxID=41427 RepID=A0AAG5D6Y8_ANOAO